MKNARVGIRGAGGMCGFGGGGQITVWIYCGGGLENNSRFGTRGAGGMCGFEGGGRYNFTWGGGR